MYTSREFDDGPKSYPQTRSKITVRVSTWRGLRRNSSSKRELRAGEIDELAAPSDLARSGVELEVGEAEHVGRVVGSETPQQGAQASEKLGECKGFRQVVVRPGVEPRDPAVDLGAGGQHQHGNLVPDAAQAPADLEPVRARHEDVEDDRIRLRVHLESPKCLLAVLGKLDVVALELERTPQGVAHSALVVDHENAHGRIVRPRSPRSERVLATS